MKLETHQTAVASSWGCACYGSGQEPEKLFAHVQPEQKTQTPGLHTNRAALLHENSALSDGIKLTSTLMSSKAFFFFTYQHIFNTIYKHVII